MTLRILHLVGSAVSDFYDDLSRMYARDCVAATADPERYDFHLAHVSPGGLWRFPDSLDGSSIAATEAMPLADAVARIEGLDLDVMVPQMFCIPGMTRYRALFDLIGIPYVGNTSDVMALTADKAMARAVVAQAGVRVPDGEVLRRGDRATLAPPMVVKPVDADNSLGVSLVRDRADVATALDEAWEHSDRALVERYVELGREVRCGTIVRDGEVTCLPLEEYRVDSVDKPIRAHADKVRRESDGAIGLVAKEATYAWIVRRGDPETDAMIDDVTAAAARCHEALGCRHYGLFDFRIDPGGEPFFLEAGLYCSFAEKSVISMMANAAGIALPALFAMSIAEALR